MTKTVMVFLPIRSVYDEIYFNEIRLRSENHLYPSLPHQLILKQILNIFAVQMCVCDSDVTNFMYL